MTVNLEKANNKGKVLVLNSYQSWKDAMLIDPTGEQEQLICFEKIGSTHAYGSCAINHQNMLHIFGGYRDRRQISRLSGYYLERIGDLTFDFAWGGCSVMENGRIFLCNPSEPVYKCRRSTGPLKNFAQIESSAYNHFNIQTSCSDSKSYNSTVLCIATFSAVLVAVGSSYHIKGEKFEDENWTVIDDPPITGTSWYQYASVFHAGHFYYFGGYNMHGDIRLRAWSTEK